MTDVVLRWAGAGDADATTDYKIYSNVAAFNAFPLLITRDATTPYAPVSTTLVAAIVAGATSLTVASDTNLANGDYVVIEREMFLLGGKSGTVFAASVGGQGGTIKRDHAAGASIYKAHETYTVTGVAFGSRKVVRYRIATLQGSVERVPSEFTAVNPTLPATNNLTTVWGILQDVQGNPQSGIAIQMVINDWDNYQPGTSESLHKDTETYTTDNDGYFEFFLPRDADHVGGDKFVLTLDTDARPAREFNINTIPDVDTINYLECA